MGVGDIMSFKEDIAGKFKDMSIRKKIGVSYNLVIVVIMVIYIVIVSSMAIVLTLSYHMKDIENNMELLDKQGKMVTREIENYTKFVICSPFVQERLLKEQLKYTDQKYIANILTGYSNSSSGIDGFILTSNGKKMYTRNLGNLLTGEAVMVDISSTYTSSIQEVTLFDAMDSGYLFFHSPMYDWFSGRYLGKVTAILNENRFYEMILDYKGIAKEIYILDHEGVIISSLNPDKNGTKYLETKGLTFEKEYSDFGWKIIYKIALVDILKQAMIPTLIIIVCGILFIGVIMILSHFIAGLISRPITTLNNAVEQIKYGDMGKRVGGLSKDEIGQLGDNFNDMMNNINHLMEEIKSVEKAKRTYEVGMIQNQVNPHFLYNCLETINGLAVIDRKDDLMSIVEELSVFYRGVLSKGKNIITVEQELVCVKSYLAILSIRYKDLHYRINVDPGVLRSSCVKMSIQPLVENAIVHGFKGLTRPWKIVVNVYERDQKIIIEVIDNGVGMKDIQQVKEGFGFNSIKDRIKLYFGDDYKLNIIQNRYCGSKIQLEVPNYLDEVIRNV